MKNLNLPVFKKFFEMTKGRTKSEDYREINEYWIKRLIEKHIENPKIGEGLCALRDGYNYEEVKAIYGISFKQFTQNVIKLGYPKNGDEEKILKLEHKGIEIRSGNPDWGAEPGKVYFVIKHGNIIKTI